MLKQSQKLRIPHKLEFPKIMALFLGGPRTRITADIGTTPIFGNPPNPYMTHTISVYDPIESLSNPM